MAFFISEIAVETGRPRRRVDATIGSGTVAMNCACSG